MMDFRSRLELATLRYVIIPLIKAGNRLDLYNFKIALNTQFLLMRYMKLLIRQVDALSGVARDKIDLIVITLVMRILVPELFLENHMHRESAEGFVTDETLARVRSEMDENSDLIQSLESQLLENPSIIECAVQFWLTTHLRCSISKDLEFAGYNLSRAQELDNSAKPMTIGDLRSIRRNTKRNVKQFKKMIIDQESDKFDINASQVIKVASFIAVFFVPSGYLYNYFLLGSFGIDPAHYFTIPDYVASSITAIRESLSVVISFVIGTAISRMRVSKERVSRVLMSKYQMSIPVSAPPHSSHVWYLLLFFIMMSITQYFIKSSAYYMFVGLSSISITVLVVDRYLFRYFKRPITMSSAIIAVAIFGISMWSSASSRAFELKNGIEHDGKNYTIYFEPELSFPSGDFVILTSTGEYYILISRDLRAYVVDRESIKHVAIKTDRRRLREIVPVP